MSKLPYFRWHPKDFDTDQNVRLMDMCEVGLYVLCLNHSWINGSLPDDIKKISKIVGQPLAKVKRSWVAVSRCFVKNESGNLVNLKQEKERTWAVERSFKSKDAVALRGKVPTTTEPLSVGEEVENHDEPYASAGASGSDSVSGSPDSLENSDAHAFIDAPIDFETFLHRWKQHRGLRKPPANIREHAKIKWLQKNILIGEVELGMALDGFASSDWAKREGYPIMGFLKDPFSWVGKTPMDSSSDWKSNTGLLRLKAAFEAIQAPVIDTDWDDACEPWCSLSQADQEKAIARVPDYDGAFIRRPKNYILRREFDRPPRPAPKSRITSLLEQA